MVRRDRDYPPGRDEDFKRLIPKPRYDEYWTREDQIELEERLSGDANFKKQCDPKTIVVGVWKTAYRFTGRLATDIIGPRTNLEFRSDSQKGSGPVWTENLCKALPDIILHPMFNLDTEKMALALQWAVICRTGDKGKYRLSGCGDDLFLRKLASVINKHQDGSRTPGELRELASYKHMMTQPAGVGPPPWSQFLGHIENIFRKPTKRKAPQSNEAAGGADEAEGDPYFVTMADVNAVRSALDRIKNVSMRRFFGARLISGAVMPSRGINDVPDMRRAKKTIRAVLLYKERNKERARRGGPLEVLPSPHRDLEPPS